MLWFKWGIFLVVHLFVLSLISQRSSTMLAPKFPKEPTGRSSTCFGVQVEMLCYVKAAVHFPIRI